MEEVGKPKITFMEPRPGGQEAVWAAGREGRLVRRTESTSPTVEPAITGPVDATRPLVRKAMIEPENNVG